MSEMVQLKRHDGLTVNLSPTGEAPLVLPRKVCTNSRPSFDRVEGDPQGVRRDERYNDGGFGLDLEVIDERPGIFGEASGAEHCNADTYRDEDVAFEHRAGAGVAAETGSGTGRRFPREEFRVIETRRASVLGGA